jgi:hypothetical protein
VKGGAAAVPLLGIVQRGHLAVGHAGGAHRPRLELVLVEDLDRDLGDAVAVHGVAIHTRPSATMSASISMPMTSAARSRVTPSPSCL